MPRLTSVLAAGSFLAVGFLYACTGEDPAPASPGGGVSSSSGGSSGATSSGGTSGTTADGSGPAAPTCAGRPFAVMKDIVPAPPVGSVDAGAWTSEMIRLTPARNKAYFSARKSADNGVAVFSATWTGEPKFDLTTPSDKVLDKSADDTNGEEWATISRKVADTQGGLIVYVNADGSGSYNLYALRSDGLGGVEFSSGPGLIFATANTDDTTPWFAGVPTEAMFWGRRDAKDVPFKINRTTVKEFTGEDPEFGKASEVPLACPKTDGKENNCGAPAVTPDLRHMLFATWPHPEVRPISGYASYEAVLDDSGKQVGETVAHPEVGARYPSWISDDGCEAIFGSSAGSIYATRTKQ